MLAKVMLGGGSYTIYEDIKNLNAQVNGMVIGISYDYFKLFDPKVQLSVEEQNSLNESFKNWIISVLLRQKKNVGVVETCDKATNSQKILLIDSYSLQRSEEKCPNCFKFVYFESKEISYYILTDVPIFICNDEGKTIETIK